MMCDGFVSSTAGWVEILARTHRELAMRIFTPSLLVAPRGLRPLPFVSLLIGRAVLGCRQWQHCGLPRVYLCSCGTAS